MTGYRTTARTLHWLVALAVILTLPAGTIMTMEGLSRNVQDTLFIFHKNIGVVIFLLVAFRLLYRAFNPPPPLPQSVPDLQRRAAGFTHVALYVMLLFMTITGYVRVTAGGFPIEYLDALGMPRPVPRSDALAETAKMLHFYGRFVLVGLVLVHVGAAVFHAVWLRDGVFSRMWPPRAPR